MSESGRSVRTLKAYTARSVSQGEFRVLTDGPHLGPGRYPSRRGTIPDDRGSPFAPGGAREVMRADPIDSRTAGASWTAMQDTSSPVAGSSRIAPRPLTERRPNMHSKDRRLDVLTQLSDGIATLTDSVEWLRHLDAQSRFHRYSFGNVVLIASQLPSASRVAGFHAWKKLGRTVAKGEKAIWILAPMTVRKEGRVRRRPGGAGIQTRPCLRHLPDRGEELPTVCHRLTGDEPAACFDRLHSVATSLGYSVEATELRDGVNGDCTFNLRRIRVEVRNASAQRAKTLAHEIAHALLHARSAGPPTGGVGSRIDRLRGLSLPRAGYRLVLVRLRGHAGPAAGTRLWPVSRRHAAAYKGLPQLILDALEVEEQTGGL